MNEIPGDLKFMKSHEWARVEDNGTVTVGISDHAQGLLGDLVYVELPSVGDDVQAGNACAVVESVKAASDVYAPISGKIAARFGAKRGDGPTWRGMFIKAPEGTDVRAIAAGRVVFANWMRGYGNLIIINHGGEYLSIYGNNQTLMKQAGDAVKPGDVIASAGNTGGNEESGLYFELRHLGKAFDPSGWIRF